MSKLLEGKTALITGANRGIGRSIAVCFARHGANVAFSDISYDDNSRSLETELEGYGVRSKGYASDAGSFEASETLVNDHDLLDIPLFNQGLHHVPVNFLHFPGKAEVLHSDQYNYQDTVDPVKIKFPRIFKFIILGNFIQIIILFFCHV